MDQPRSSFRLAALVFLAAALVRLLCWSGIRPTALDRWHEWDQSDMHTYLEQARRIATGDALGRDPFHPWHLWQRAVPESRWLAWYPPRSFHQAPAYSYFMALLSPLAPRDIPAAKLIQVLLGALNAVLLCAIARRLAGPAAGVIAGLIAAVYGPLIQIELQILRDGPFVCGLSAVLLLLMHHGRASAASGLGRRGCLRLGGIGAALGALVMLHETAQVALATALVTAVWAHGFGPLPRRARLDALAAAACLAAGAAVGFSPLLARNLAVGAPPLSVSSRSAVVFAMSNHALAPDGGSRWGVADAELARVMDAAAESLFGTFGAVAASYSARWSLLPRNLALKARGVLAIHEAPDNTSWSFYRSRSAAMRWLPGWWLVFAPAVGGLVLLLARRSGPDPSGDEPAAAHRVSAVMFAVFFLMLLAALSLVHSLGRLRLCILPAAIPLAGVFFAAMGNLARGRRAAGTTVSVFLFLLAAGLQAVSQVSLAPARFRPADFVVAANLERGAGELDQAAEDYRRAIELGMHSPGLMRALGLTLRALGRDAEAEEWLRAADARQPFAAPQNALDSAAPPP